MSIASPLQQAVALHRQGRLAEAERLYRDLLGSSPNNFNVLQLLGTVCAQQRRYTEAVEYLQRAIAIDALLASTHSNLGNALQSLGLYAAAVASYDRALQLNPNSAEVLYYRGNAMLALKNPQAALPSFEQAAALNPTHAGILNNLAGSLLVLNRPEEARTACESGLVTSPNNPDLWNNLSIALEKLQRHKEAADCLQKLTTLDRKRPAAFFRLGNVLLLLGRRPEALMAFESTLQLQPGHLEALDNKGNALQEAGLNAEALATYDRLLALRPDYAGAWCNRGNVLHKLQQNQLALASHEKALQLEPGFAEAWNGLGVALMSLYQKESALAAYVKALALKPDSAITLANYSQVLMQCKRFAEAAGVCDRALELDPSIGYLAGVAVMARQHICDWHDYAAKRKHIIDGVVAGQQTCLPFIPMMCCDDPAVHLHYTANFADDRVAKPPQPLWRGEQYGHHKIRVAYLSADFHAHATANLMAELFELHDREQFEWFGFSFGPKSNDEMRLRVQHAFDHFEDVAYLTDAEIAQRVRACEIDIAVDLKGFTMHCRPGVFAQRPAPVQVSYLGYPGSMGVPWMDYIVVDPVLVPVGDEHYYREQVVRLPDTYQVNDRKRPLGLQKPTRAASGLPAKGFVFCCFNNNCKITPDVFTVWMRLLLSVKGSVLWLLRENPELETNLRQEAQERGVAPERLVFAPRCSLEAHLARHHCADLFLDTLPYNAHTTASDALWTGLPLLTCAGRTFASRVAASLLQAIELPELITSNLQQYEKKALELARSPKKLAALRRKLEKNRLTTPLFDSQRFARHIEAAYRQMHERCESGLPTAAFDVARLPPQPNVVSKSRRRKH